MAQNPLLSKSYLSMVAMLTEPTGLFSGLLVVPRFACAACLLWSAAFAVASSLFWVWHSCIQWPSLLQWWQLPLQHLLLLPSEVPVVVRALSSEAYDVLQFLPLA
jgi:hypothetical protein